MEKNTCTVNLNLDLFSVPENVEVTETIVQDYCASTTEKRTSSTKRIKNLVAKLESVETELITLDPLLNDIDYMLLGEELEVKMTISANGDLCFTF
jgi:hypothetical protein